jgi:hypothetical protein
MYHGVRELWAGWRKNAADAWDAPPLATAAGAAAIGAIVWAPWAGAVRRRPVAVAALALQYLALRAPGRALGLPRRYALTAPLGAAFLAAVGAASVLDRMRGRGVRWRGRSLPAAR